MIDGNPTLYKLSSYNPKSIIIVPIHKSIIEESIRTHFKKKSIRGTRVHL